MKPICLFILFISSVIYAETAKTGDYAIKDAGIDADIFESSVKKVAKKPTTKSSPSRRTKKSF